MAIPEDPSRALPVHCVRDAVLVGVFTLAVHFGFAAPAGPAGNGEGNNNALAWLVFCDPWSDGVDYSAAFVAEDVAFLELGNYGC